LAYGVFFDNTYRSVFDFGKESPDFLLLRRPRRRAELLFYCGPEPKKIIEEYTAMTGRSPLPPLGRWAPASRYRTIRNRAPGRSSKHCAKKKIPADAIYFDIDYPAGHALHGNREYFPTFEKMISDFRGPRHATRS